MNAFCSLNEHLFGLWELISNLIVVTVNLGVTSLKSIWNCGVQILVSEGSSEV